MSNLWTIARRELGAYFVSPIAYVVVALFLALHVCGLQIAVATTDDRPATQATLAGLEPRPW